MGPERASGYNDRNTDIFRRGSSAMRRPIWLFVLTIIVAASLGAQAKLATETEASLVAANWVTEVSARTGGWASSDAAVVGAPREIVTGDTLLGWYWHVEPSGYVVVPGLKEMPPVKMYSENYSFDLDEPDGPAKLIREVLTDRFRRFAAAYGELDAEQPVRGPVLFGPSHRREWDRLAVPEAVFADELASTRPTRFAEAGPLLTTVWHQGSPYNNFCPMGDGGRTVVGCVATAAAQILRYHGAPETGFGTHSYYWGGDDSCGGSTSGQTLVADYTDTYDWANMPNSAGGGSSQAEKDALAELNYEVGVAFNMDYGRCGSGAYTSYAQTVFPTYFGYSDAIDRENRYAHSQTSWFSIIQEEVNLGRPMEYRITGHAIVCDGWRDTGTQLQYHMNYGWADSHNAWYTLDDLYISDDPMDEFVIRRIIPPPPGWADATNGTPLGDTGDCQGVAWVDYDNDVDLDLYVVKSGGANLLLENNGGGSFTDVATGVIADGGAGTGAAWGDFDNDGDPDVYLVKDGEANVLVRNDGGLFTDVTSSPLDDSGSGTGASWFDADADGDLDLYLTNSGTANRLFRNDGGSFVDVTSGPLASAAVTNGTAWGDYDNDGDLDVYLVNDGANELLRNDGSGAFTDVTAGPLGDAGQGYGAAWGDYDNDGDMDLYVSNGGANKLLENDGGSFSDVTGAPLTSFAAGRSAAWLDYDLDGDLDLYVVNDGSNALFRNDGAAGFADVTEAPNDDGGSGRGAAWGDYDNDGDLDCYVSNEGGANVLLRNDVPPLRQRLYVRTVGDESNRDGVGARVRVVTGTGSQMRDVVSASSFLSQDSPAVEFGLGSEPDADSLVVVWPNGVVNRYWDVAVNQTVTLEEIVPPGAPANIATVPIEAGIEVGWNEVSSDHLLHYLVERDTTTLFGSGTEPFVTTDTVFVDFPIVDDRDYSYRVTAVCDGDVQSPASGTATASAQQTAPAAPASLTATPQEAAVRVAWPASASPDVDHYIVERDTTPAFGAATVSETVTDTSYVDAPLGPGPTYYYRVTTVDWYGLSSGSSETASAVPLQSPPTTPEGIAAESGDGVVTLSWDENPEPDISFYVIYRDTVPEFSAADSLAKSFSTTMTDDTASGLTPYFYTITARDMTGYESGMSDTVMGIPVPGQAVYVDASNNGYQNGSFGYPYDDIQEGIDTAESGGTVLVFEGTYDGNLVLSKDLLLLAMSGPSNTEILANTGSAIMVTGVGDSTRIQGFSIDGLGTASAGIDIVGCNPTLSDCIVRGASSGGRFRSGATPDVVRTTFAENTYGIETQDTASPRLISNTFYGQSAANIMNSGSVGPIVGGSLESANDFLDSAYFHVFNTGTAMISAELNWWSDDCPDSTWFSGGVDWSPWTDETHTLSMTECGTGVDDGVPLRPALRDNYPNPFNPVTTIRFDVPSPGGRVLLTVHDVSGRVVTTLVDDEVPGGRHNAVWSGRDAGGRPVASGVYFYRIGMPGFEERRKMVLLK
ncbi:MAG: T9SS type A sorting domain-containing protein [Candidatus Eisenbacteria bacterium]|nr:T9SS type A sorting domain-containing protein [Candidatus Eisenbacteria bacterium]